MSPAGWLPVHRDQLWAQRSVTSIGKLYLLMWIYIVLYDTYLYRALWHVWSVNPYENSTTVKWAINCYLPAANSIAAVLPNPLLDEWRQEAWVWTTCPGSLREREWPEVEHVTASRITLPSPTQLNLLVQVRDRRPNMHWRSLFHQNEYIR